MTNNATPLAKLPTYRLLAEFSLWSADLVRLADDIARVDPFVDIYHGDVSDGHFSPELLLFPDVIAQIRPLTDVPFHVHLMAADAILHEQIDQFADAGADIISIHAENSNAEAGLDRILSRGISAGLVLQLHTPIDSVAKVLDPLAILTLLGTKIGIKGVGLDPTAEARLVQAREMIRQSASGGQTLLAADGGIREHTVPGLRRSGADTIDMGSLAFCAQDLPTRMQWIHELPGPE